MATDHDVLESVVPAVRFGRSLSETEIDRLVDLGVQAEDGWRVERLVGDYDYLGRLISPASRDSGCEYMSEQVIVGLAPDATRDAPGPRPVYTEALNLKLPAGTIARLDAARKPEESRLTLIRAAIESVLQDRSV